MTSRFVNGREGFPSIHPTQALAFQALVRLSCFRKGLSLCVSLFLQRHYVTRR